VAGLDLRLCDREASSPGLGRPQGVPRKTGREKSSFVSISPRLPFRGSL